MSAFILIGSLYGMYVAFKSVIALMEAELYKPAWEQLFVIGMFMIVIGYAYLNQSNTIIHITF